MTCESIQEELVAYCDGELPEHDRARIAAHLRTCAACARVEAQLVQVEQLLTKMERVSPSVSFAPTFWERLEKEKSQPALNFSEPIAGKEHFLIRWWREMRETLHEWHIAPVLAATASLLVFFSYFFMAPSMRTENESSNPILAQAPQPVASTPVAPDAPADLLANLELYTQYHVIADLEEFTQFDAIAAIQLPAERSIEVAEEDELPPELLQNPSFFAHYPILQEMDKLENLEAVLDMPTTTDDDPWSRG